MDIWEQATALHMERRYAEAELLYDKLLTQNPDNAGLLATLGTLYLQTQRVGMAICLLEYALKRGPRQSDILSNLGVAYKYAGLTEKAIPILKESIAIEPTGEAYANYSALLIESGQDAKCREICKKAIDLSPDHPIAHWNLALSLLADGDFGKGWDEYEWGLKEGSMRINRNLGRVPEWDGTPGKRVAVYGEQGIGDEIMFASMLPDLLKTNEVALECHTRLKTLFEKSFPGVACYGTREDPEPQWPADDPFEYRLSIGSLGKFYRRSRESFPGTPYLKADPLPKGKKFRVGISWQGGGAKLSRVQKRSIPLSWWKSILNVNDVEFVSLQYTDAADEIKLVNELGYDIKQMDEYVKAEDYYETARLVASCDLVITIITAVAHLAGALGIPCWAMTPAYPPWTWQNKGGSPWYRSVRLYRQPESKQDSWMPVIQRIGLDLEDLVRSERRILVAA